MLLLSLLTIAILTHPLAGQPEDENEFLNIVFDRVWDTILEEDFFALDPLKVTPETITISPQKGPLAVLKMVADCNLYDIVFHGLKYTHRTAPVEVDTDYLEEGLIGLSIHMEGEDSVLVARMNVSLGFAKLSDRNKKHHINLTIASDNIKINPKLRVNLEEQTVEVDQLNISNFNLTQVKVESDSKDKASNLTSTIIEQAVPYLLQRLESVASKKVQSILNDKLEPIIDYINDSLLDLGLE